MNAEIIGSAYKFHSEVSWGYKYETDKATLIDALGNTHVYSFDVECERKLRETNVPEAPRMR